MRSTIRDRDHEPKVRLDHALLRGHVAALDALRELDLVGGGEQRMAPDLAQEELKRVGRRLDRRVERILVLRLRGRRLSGRLDGAVALVDELDAPLLELAQERFDVGGLELSGLDRLTEIGVVDEAARLGGLEQLLKLLARCERSRLVRH
jgi:hypothetical protein